MSYTTTLPAIFDAARLLRRHMDRTPLHHYPGLSCSRTTQTNQPFRIPFDFMGQAPQQLIIGCVNDIIIQ